MPLLAQKTPIVPRLIVPRLKVVSVRNSTSPRPAARTGWAQMTARTDRPRAGRPATVRDAAGPAAGSRRDHQRSRRHRPGPRDGGSVTDDRYRHLSRLELGSSSTRTARTCSTTPYWCSSAGSVTNETVASRAPVGLRPDRGPAVRIRRLRGLPSRIRLTNTSLGDRVRAFEGRGVRPFRPVGPQVGGGGDHRPSESQLAAAPPPGGRPVKRLRRRLEAWWRNRHQRRVPVWLL